MTTPQLTPARIARLFARLITPAAASKASARVHALFVSTNNVRYLDLSAALNEHRHAILAGFSGDAKAVSEHVSFRDELARWATKPVRRVA
jgi:hypothetical protein